MREKAEVFPHTRQSVQSRYDRTHPEESLLCPLHKVYVLEFLCGWFDRIEYVAQHSDVLVNAFDPGFQSQGPPFQSTAVISACGTA
jgi:hypothetical protein